MAGEDNHRTSRGATEQRKLPNELTYLPKRELVTNSEGEEFRVFSANFPILWPQLRRDTQLAGLMRTLRHLPSRVKRQGNVHFEPAMCSSRRTASAP